MFQILLLLSFAAQPQFIEVNLDLTVEGKKLSTIKALTEAGKKQVVTQKVGANVFTIELTPKVENGDELHVSLRVLENQKVISTPEVITFDQQEAMIESSDMTNKTLQLSIVPKIL